MLTVPPPSQATSAPNMQSVQMLSSPNARSLQNLQQYSRMGLRQPGGMSIPGTQPVNPTSGMNVGGASGLSQNPLTQQNMMAMITALLGGRGQ